MNNDTLPSHHNDNHTVALYHFDEGNGNEAHCACGDPALTLHAEQADWGKRPGGGSVARFARRKDDANVFVGPVNNDRLQLRPCTEEWTIEAWVRIIGPAGQQKQGTTYSAICATDDEGFGLDGVRGGWIFSLANHDALFESADAEETDCNALEQYGVAPSGRFMGSLAGRDPQHDTAGMMYPRGDRPGTLYAGVDRRGFIRDNEWHHVAWQFRYEDQTNYFFIDRELVASMQLPTRENPLRTIKNDGTCGVPFTVGGFVHSQDPPFHLGYGNMNGEIAELRISSRMRYPVAESLSIVKTRGAVSDNLNIVAGKGLPFRMSLNTDAAEGSVSWHISEGELPAGLNLDSSQGVIDGKPRTVDEPTDVTLEAVDEAGHVDHHTVGFAVESGRISTSSLPSAFGGKKYAVQLETKHLADPLHWSTADNALPDGLQLDEASGFVTGTPKSHTVAEQHTFQVSVTDDRGECVEKKLTISVLPSDLADMQPDDHTIFMYDWQQPEARPVPDVMGDEDLTLDWTNMGGDRRVEWPGRKGRFPQETGHGEHGYASVATDNDKHNLRTCHDEWTVEAWIRRGGPFQAHGRSNTEHTRPFDYGHICGTYDTTERGVWELYLSDHESPDGSMAPGVHFFGEQPEQALTDLHPWKRPNGIVGDPPSAGIDDSEWHHIAWQYSYETDEHELFLDGRLIWTLTGPDGRRLVNNRRHDAQFSVFSRLDGYVIRGRDKDDAKTNNFNWMGWGNFFGQIGEIRVSDIRMYSG